MIKDALGYLRLVASRADDPSFERICNVPPRGLGNKTLEAVRELSKTEQGSLWAAARTLMDTKALPTRAISALTAFLELIDRLEHDTRGLDLAEQVETVLRASGLLDHYGKEKSERAEARVENLQELVSATRNFDFDGDEGMEPLAAFLAHAALEAGEGQAEAWEDCVQLMSLHSAKGLEFGVVFLTGLEEGLFPHQRSISEPGRLEEERRLCYVGMTRAMEQLYVTHAEVRRLYGTENYTSPSRFLGEFPDELMQAVRAQGTVMAPWNPHVREPDPGGTGMHLGQRVRHGTFGEGIVLNVEGEGQHARVQVNFEEVGSKWLVMAYANLEQVS